MLATSVRASHSPAQMKQRTRRRTILLRLLCALLLVVFGLSIATGALTEATDGSTPAPKWSAPSAMVIKRVSDIATAQREPVFMSNLDCNLIDYRTPQSSTMQTGCFTETAYGLMDTDHNVVIFNGTDEGLPLLHYASKQVLAPWPKSSNLVSMGVLNTGGTYLSMYRNLLSSMQDERNSIGQLTAKRLTAPADIQVNDAAGQRLIINPETMAFSSNGSWMVVETLTGSFVRINLTTLNTVAFAPAFGTAGSSALLSSRVAVSDDGRYVAIANYAAQTFKVYDLTTCNGGAGNCQSYNYQPFAQQKISGLTSIGHMRFVNNGLLSFEARTTNTSSGGIYVLAPNESIVSLIDYLGLGDSYTSGEGAFDYLSGTDIASNSCHLSAKSYPLLLTRDLFSPLGGHSVACSGAVIKDVGTTGDSYRGQVQNSLSFTQLSESEPALLTSVKTNFIPGYISQQRFVQQYQPRIVTVSVGGNDIGFGDIVQNCVIPHVSRHLSDNTCYNTYEDRLELTKLVDRTVSRWSALYKQLQADAPGTRLYAIGYPQVVDDTGKCGLNVHLNKSELEFTLELISYINAGVAKAALKAGVTYVDISKALYGFRLCETASYNVAVNGLTAGKDAGVLGLKVFGRESYHPNALGQELIEQAILKQTKNLTTAPMPPPPVTPNLLGKPKSGRSITTKAPASRLSPPIAKRGKATSLNATGVDNGLRPHKSYTVRLDGASGTLIGTVTSDGDGDISDSVTIPGETPVGGHTIDIIGENQAGEPVDVTQPIYVPASDTDSDGDDIPDTTDSCPGAINSGVDEDQDGIDDVCDSLIGQPPTTPSGQGSGVNENTLDGIASGNNLSPRPVVAIANFVVTTPLQGNTDGTPKILANSLTRPRKARAAPASIQLSARRINAIQPAPYSALRVINWLQWLLLPLLWWLVLLALAAGLKRIHKR
ncbi:MAG: hypothetical protein JWO35_920 [Candidatus Saccharibacteria bacterium]|nr:hypothetical protein [Candidatus Saccharibacteria bacterium]